MMKIPGLDNSAVIDKQAMSLFLAGGTTAVLLLHGYLGSPDDVIFLGKKLQSCGFTVSIPRLPGHGTSGRDFLTSGSRDWLRTAFDTYAELKSRYSRVYIAGYSMGGLLAIIASSVFKPAGLILVAPAVTNYKRFKINISPLIMMFVKKIKRVKNQEADTEFDKKLMEEYWQYDWPASAYEILKMQKESIKRLKMISCPALLLLSEKDRTVPLKAAEIVKKNIPSGILYEARVSNSSHVIFKGPEKEKAAGIITEWLAVQENNIL